MILLVALYVFQLLCASLWGGFVAKVLWNWFVPALNFPHITFWEAVGLLALVNLLTLKPSYQPRAELDELLPNARFGIFFAVAAPALLLLIGYVAKTHHS